MPPVKGKSAKAGPSKGKVKGGGLTMPSVSAGAEDVEAAKGVGYYTGPVPPASIYRLHLKQVFIKNNKNQDWRITWVAEIAEDHPQRTKYNGFGFINGENYSEQGMRYVNAMLDAIGIDRKLFHGGQIKVDDPKADLTQLGAKMVVEAVGKQSLEESAGVHFYVATKKEKEYQSDELTLGFQQYMTEDDWERAIASLDDSDNPVDDEDEDEDDDSVTLDEDDEESDDEDDDSEDEDEDDEESDDEEDEEEDEDEDDEEEDDDEEPDLSELSPKELKARIVADARWTDFTKTANLKGYEKDTMVDMLANGPQEPKKAGKKAKKGKATTAPF